MILTVQLKWILFFMRMKINKTQQLSDLRAEYDLRLRFLRDQIELKDRRMDEKDQMINRLMEKCL